MSGAGVPNLSPRISRRFTKATRLFATGSPPYLKRSPICPKMDLPMSSPANTLSVPPVEAFADLPEDGFADVVAREHAFGAAGAVFIPAGLGDDAFDARLVEDERGRVLGDIDARAVGDDGGRMLGVRSAPLIRFLVDARHERHMFAELADRDDVEPLIGEGAAQCARECFDQCLGCLLPYAPEFPVFYYSCSVLPQYSQMTDVPSEPCSVAPQPRHALDTFFAPAGLARPLMLNASAISLVAPVSPRTHFRCRRCGIRTRRTR